MPSIKHILAAFTFVSSVPATAAIVGHTFTGVTTSQPTELNAEFPAGTKWTLRVEWDDSAAALFTSSTQSSWRLTKLTLTLQGKSGPWTTSSLSGKPSFSLNEYGGTDEIQFTSGWGPTEHSNQTIGTLQPYSINVTLSDPTGMALNGVTPVPSAIDMTKWDPSTSEFKFYLDASAFKVQYGSVDFASNNKPDIAVLLNSKSLADGNAKVGFGTSKVATKGAVKTFTVRNAGKAALKNLSVKVTGVAKKEFQILKPAKTQLAPGAKTTFKVTFKPKKSGTRKALLKILSNDPDENPFEIKLEGKGK